MMCASSFSPLSGLPSPLSLTTCSHIPPLSPISARNSQLIVAQDNKLPVDIAANSSSDLEVVKVLHKAGHDAAQGFLHLSLEAVQKLWQDDGQTGLSSLFPGDLPDSNDDDEAASVIKAFQRLAPQLDPNLRRLKRIVNVNSLISEVAKLMPSEYDYSKVPLALHGMCLFRGRIPCYACD